MKRNQKGFGHMGILLIVLVIAAGAAVGWYVWDKNKKEDKTTTQTAQAVKTEPVDPYAGWKTYTSATEKSHFKYPTTWTTGKISSDNSVAFEGGDSLKLTAPSDGMFITWTATIGGLGGVCDDTILPPHVNANGMQACPYFTVLDKQKLSGANLTYVAGIVTRDGSTYNPWFSLADKNGFTKSGSYLGLQVFQAKNSQWSSALISGYAPTGSGITATTKEKATAFFTTQDGKDAKLILTSYTY